LVIPSSKFILTFSPVVQAAKARIMTNVHNPRIMVCSKHRVSLRQGERLKLARDKWSQDFQAGQIKKQAANLSS
jgi:hypothetical protein